MGSLYYLQIASDAGLARRSALPRRTLAIENGCVSPDLMLMRSNYRVRRAMANPDRQTDLNGQQDAVGRLQRNSISVTRQQLDFPPRVSWNVDPTRNVAEDCGG